MQNRSKTVFLLVVSKCTQILTSHKILSIYFIGKVPKSSNFVKSRKNVIFSHFVGGLGLGLGGRYQHIHENLEWRNLNKKGLL